MAYLLDDGWDNCGPVARAGNACFGLYVRCGIWVARNLTDGFVPGEIVSAYGSPEQARKLVDVGLWEAVDGGYLAVDYLTLNKTATEVSKRRKAESERKARWRENAKNARKPGKKPGKDGPRGTGRGTPTGQDAGLDAGGTFSLSFSSKEEKGGARPASPGAARAAEPARSPSDDVENPDWRRMPAFGAERDPAAAERSHRGAAAAAAEIRQPKFARGRLDPVQAARQRGSSLDPLTGAVAEVYRLDDHRPLSEEVFDADDHASA